MTDPTGDLGLTRADAWAIAAWLVVFFALAVIAIALLRTAWRRWRSRRRP